MNENTSTDTCSGGIDRAATVPDPRDELSQIVAGVLSDRYPDPIYTVEDGTVWVSGMTAHATHIANVLAKELVHSEGIPCSLVRDDNAVAFPGVEFDYYDPDLLENADSSTTDMDRSESN